jgi:hypothetical protein
LSDVGGRKAPSSVGQFNAAEVPSAPLRACDYFDPFVFTAYSTSCIQAPRQIRHPERSASQIYRVNSTWRRGVEEPVIISILSCFLHTQPVVFKPPDNFVILSGAPHRLSRDTALGARSRRACHFFDPFVFSAYSISRIQAPRQIRHPERSASQIHRVNSTWRRGVEEPVIISILLCFLHIQPVVFKPPDKFVILSGAPHRLSRDTALGARSRRICDFFDPFVFSAYSTSCIQAPRQIRHPERSASQIYRVNSTWRRGVEGPQGSLSYPCCSPPFSHRSPPRGLAT